jgi:lysophospholipase L1-like esterase
MIPPPLYKDGQFDIQQNVINKIYPKIIPKLAFEELNFDQGQIINLFEAIGGENLTRPEFFDDFCHPNNEGYEAIAEEVSKHIMSHI